MRGYLIEQPNRANNMTIKTASATTTYQVFAYDPLTDISTYIEGFDTIIDADDFAGKLVKSGEYDCVCVRTTKEFFIFKDNFKDN